MNIIAVAAAAVSFVFAALYFMLRGQDHVLAGAMSALALVFSVAGLTLMAIYIAEHVIKIIVIVRGG